MEENNENKVEAVTEPVSEPIKAENTETTTPVVTSGTPVTEKKGNKKGLVIVIAIIGLVLVVGLVIFFVLGALKKDDAKPNNDNNSNNVDYTTTPEDNSIGGLITSEDTPVTDDSSSNTDDNKNLVEEMITYTIKTLYEYKEGVSKIELSSEDIIEDDKCLPGIGCQKISNWDKISAKFTDNYVKNLANTDTTRMVVIIDDVAYLKDSSSGLELEKIEMVEILNETDSSIIAQASVNVTNYLAGVFYDADGNQSYSKENKSIDMSIVKENDTWKVDSFEMN